MRLQEGKEETEGILPACYQDGAGDASNVTCERHGMKGGMRLDMQRQVDLQYCEDKHEKRMGCHH